MHSWPIWIALAAAAAPAHPATPVPPTPLQIARLPAGLAFDGHADGPAWRLATAVQLTTFLPVAGQHPTDSSDVRLAYDDTYLYVSARLYVSDPAEIQGTTLGRDQLGPDDRFRIMLDSYDDDRSGVAFLVTPTGARSDYDISDDGATVSSDWNTYWDAATTRDAHGWYVEMRIPWSSLRFRPVDGRVTMGLIVLRVSARKNEWSTYPALSPTAANAIWRASAARKVVFEGLERHSPVYVTPYVLGQADRTARLNSAGTAWGYDRPRRITAGGDFKYGLNDQLTLDLTANTDFAQVEADNQQVNLTRFSLFFPEKRQFFLERAGSFDFSTGGDGSRLFYSRRIGLAENGAPLSIYGGGRLVGQAGPWDLGVLDLQVAPDSGVGSENLGVLRVRHQVINAGSYVGGIVTSRTGGGHYNAVYGLDAKVNVFGTDYVTGQWAQSFDDRIASGWGASQARLKWARESSQGLIYTTAIKWSGPQFEPRLGFESHQDYSYGSLELDYRWIGRSGALLQPSFFGYAYRRNRDGKIDSGELYPYVDFGLPNGVYGWVAWRDHREDLTGPLSLSSTVTVPAGRYGFQQGELYVRSGTGARLGSELWVDVGPFYDGRQVYVDLTPTWSLSPHLTLGGEYQLNRVTFPSRKQVLDADVARLRISVAWNTKLSAQTFLQYNAEGRVAVGNAVVHYQFSEGHDLYLVYSDQVNTDRAGVTPPAPMRPFSQARTLILKYSRTFIR